MKHPRLEPRVVEVLADAATGLRACHVEFCVIGALVPALLLDTPPARFTKDADLTVALDSLEQFDDLKHRLTAFGFEGNAGRPCRLTHRTGGWVDLLPYSPSLAPNGRLEFDRDLSFNLTGFERALPNAVPVVVTDALTVPSFRYHSL